ncbi:MAG TPA: hypothetical protein VND83_05395 [Acidimicrobiales bacterium]|nr:hypothetical protein [Acidimicrobiales bacterium]
MSDSARATTEANDRRETALSHRDAGDTLIEVLMALLVLSVVVLSLMLAFSTSLSASAEHRDLAVSDSILRDVSEAVFAQVEQDHSFTTTCLGPSATESQYLTAYNAELSSELMVPSPYQNVSFKYSASITQVEFWNGDVSASYPFTPDPTVCTGGAPQLFTITVTNPGGSTSAVAYLIGGTGQIATFGASENVFLSGCSGSIEVGSPCTVTATIEDASGDTVPTYNGNIIFAQTGGSGSVTGLGSATAVHGVTTLTLTGATTGAVTIQATADSSVANSISNTLTFNVTGPPTQLVLAGCTPSVQSGSTCVVTATAEDSGGNIVNSYTGSVTFSQTGGSGVVTGLGTASAANGIASVTLTGTTVGPVTVEGSASGLTPGSESFDVAPAQLLLTGCSSSIKSGSTCTLTATLQDGSGNTVTSYNGPVSFTQAAGSGAVTDLGATTSFTNGVASVTVTGTTVGSVSVQATGDGLTSTTVTFSVTAAQLVLSGCTGSLPLHGTCVATATLEDGSGNAVITYNGSVTFTQTAGPGAVTGLGSVTSFTNGVASVTLKGTTVGSVTIRATGDSLTSNTVTFSVVQTHLVFTSTPGGPRTGFSVTVTVEDGSGNVVTTDSTDVITLTRASGTGSFGGGTLTVSNGVAAFTNLTWSNSGAKTLTASSPGVTSATSPSFTLT